MLGCKKCNKFSVTNRQPDGWMGRWIERGCMGVCMYVYMYGWMNGWILLKRHSYFWDHFCICVNGNCHISDLIISCAKFQPVFVILHITGRLVTMSFSWLITINVYSVMSVMLRLLTHSASYSYSPQYVFNNIIQWYVVNL